MTESSLERAGELAGIEKVVLLQTVDLFRLCKAEHVLRISALAVERRLEAGEKLYERGDPADALYCVVRGTVRLEDSEGKVESAGPLRTFGVEEILSGRLRSATATAETESLLLAINSEDFFDLLSNNIEIVRALFRRLLPERGGSAGTPRSA